MNSLQIGDTSIITDRLVLMALTVHDADEMVGVLDDERLHEFTGGRPDTLSELRDRYRRYVAGPTEPGDSWLNWVVRSKLDGSALGTMQATVSTSSDAGRIADVAWVIGVGSQGQGFASEAARALVDWLLANGVDEVTAHIHPDHHASAMVASRAGLRPTVERADGEIVWRLTNTRQVGALSSGRHGAGPPPRSSPDGPGTLPGPRRGTS
jgi:RimJ/RimL family protein N-acetyltransferase